MEVRPGHFVLNYFTSWLSMPAHLSVNLIFVTGIFMIYTKSEQTGPGATIGGMCATRCSGSLAVR